jgi:hypothetical protein
MNLIYSPCWMNLYQILSRCQRQTRFQRGYREMNRKPHFPEQQNILITQTPAGIGHGFPMPIPWRLPHKYRDPAFARKLRRGKLVWDLKSNVRNQPVPPPQPPADHVPANLLGEPVQTLATIRHSGDVAPEYASRNASKLLIMHCQSGESERKHHY